MNKNNFKKVLKINIRFYTLRMKTQLHRGHCVYYTCLNSMHIYRIPLQTKACINTRFSGLEEIPLPMGPMYFCFGFNGDAATPDTGF